MNGQNARRPTIASSAGSSVHITSIASPMPIAPISPSPAVPLTSARDRHSSPAITVPPEATIAGPARPQGVAMATCLSWWRRSSSR